MQSTRRSDAVAAGPGLRLVAVLAGAWIAACGGVAVAQDAGPERAVSMDAGDPATRFGLLLAAAERLQAELTAYLPPMLAAEAHALRTTLAVAQARFVATQLREPTSAAPDALAVARTRAVDAHVQALGDHLTRTYARMLAAAEAALRELWSALPAAEWLASESEWAGAQQRLRMLVEQALRADLAAVRNHLQRVADEAVRQLSPVGATASPARPTLGLVVENAELGVRVVAVTPGGAAFAAGIRTRDLIVAIDGEDLAAGPGREPPILRFFARQAQLAADALVILELRRDGAPLRVVVALRPADRVAERPVAPADRRVPVSAIQLRGELLAELELVAVTPELGAYFGTDTGLLVVRAPRTVDLGLRDGDVIVAIGDRAVSSPEQAVRVWTALVAGDLVRVFILRQRQTYTLEWEIAPIDRGLSAPHPAADTPAAR